MVNGQVRGSVAAEPYPAHVHVRHAHGSEDLFYRASSGAGHPVFSASARGVRLPLGEQNSPLQQVVLTAMLG